MHAEISAGSAPTPATLYPAASAVRAACAESSATVHSFLLPPKLFMAMSYTAALSRLPAPASVQVDMVQK